MTPPASTEPMHCDQGSPTKDGKIACMKSSGCDYQEFSDLRIPLMYCTRARAPVVAKQAPDLSHVHPDRHGCLTCLNPDCPIWQAADQNCWKSLAEHDAALLAQQAPAEKPTSRVCIWTAQYEYGGYCPGESRDGPNRCDGCPHEKTIEEHNAALIIQAREDVLKEIVTAMKSNGGCPPDKPCINNHIDGCVQCWTIWIESLRPGQKQEREQE